MLISAACEVHEIQKCNCKRFNFQWLYIAAWIVL